MVPCHDGKTKHCSVSSDKEVRQYACSHTTRSPIIDMYLGSHEERCSRYGLHQQTSLGDEFVQGFHGREPGGKLSVHDVVDNQDILGFFVSKRLG